MRFASSTGTHSSTSTLRPCGFQRERIVKQRLRGFNHVPEPVIAAEHV